MKRNLIIISFIYMLLSVPAGFAQNTAELWVTNNFSQNLLLDAEVHSQNESVMEILRTKTQLQTGFADAFVVGINGIASSRGNGQGSDWFYYVNGILAQVGALQYIVREADRIWWDFHQWENAAYVSSVVGAFPQPFLSGYDRKIYPTAIVSFPEFSSEIKGLAQTLEEKGVKAVAVAEYPQGMKQQENAYTILVGTWEQIQRDKTIAEMAGNFKKTNFFVKFDGNRLQALDFKGNPAKALEHAGVILSLSAGFQTTPPLWIITGTDVQEVKKAVNLLAENSEKIRFHSGVVLSDGKIINVPINNEQ